jgi:hypothetical protein
MRKGKRSEGAVLGTVLGLVLLAGEVALILTGLCFGWVIGGLLAVLSFFVIGGKYQKVWKCKTCRIVISRA